MNWHDRSIAPERLWTGTYVSLVKELRDQGAWFATASRAIDWFRMRRSVKFEVNREGSVRTTLSAGSDDGLPELRLRTHGGASGEPSDIILARSFDACGRTPIKTCS